MSIESDLKNLTSLSFVTVFLKNVSFCFFGPFWVYRISLIWMPFGFWVAGYRMSEVGIKTTSESLTIEISLNEFTKTVTRVQQQDT